MCFLAVQMTKSGITGLQLQGSKKVPPSPSEWVYSCFFFLTSQITDIQTSKLLHRVAVVKVEKTLLVQMVHSVGGWKNRDL